VVFTFKNEFKTKNEKNRGNFYPRFFSKSNTSFVLKISVAKKERKTTKSFPKKWGKTLFSYVTAL